MTKSSSLVVILCQDVTVIETSSFIVLKNKVIMLESCFSAHLIILYAKFLSRHDISYLLKGDLTICFLKYITILIYKYCNIKDQTNSSLYCLVIFLISLNLYVSYLLMLVLWLQILQILQKTISCYCLARTTNEDMMFNIIIILILILI